MAHITLTGEQEWLVAEAQKSVEVRDGNGNVIGYIQLVVFTPAEIADARRRLASDEPRYTTAQVLAHLRSLEQK